MPLSNLIVPELFLKKKNHERLGNFFFTSKLCSNHIIDEFLPNSYIGEHNKLHAPYFAMHRGGYNAIHLG